MRLLVNLPDHRLHLLDNRANVFERFYVGDLEFHAKFRFDRNNKVNVVKRVPVGNFFPSGILRQHDRIVQQNIPENAA